jgi:hypothetical protein
MLHLSVIQVAATASTTALTNAREKPRKQSDCRSDVLNRPTVTSSFPYAELPKTVLAMSTEGNTGTPDSGKPSDCFCAGIVAGGFRKGC